MRYIVYVNITSCTPVIAKKRISEVKKHLDNINFFDKTDKIAYFTTLNESRIELLPEY